MLQNLVPYTRGRSCRQTSGHVASRMPFPWMPSCEFPLSLVLVHAFKLPAKATKYNISVWSMLDRSAWIIVAFSCMPAYNLDEMHIWCSLPNRCGLAVIHPHATESKGSGIGISLAEGLRLGKPPIEHLQITIRFSILPLLSTSSRSALVSDVGINLVRKQPHCATPIVWQYNNSFDINSSGLHSIKRNLKPLPLLPFEGKMEPEGYRKVSRSCILSSSTHHRHIRVWVESSA